MATGDISSLPKWARTYIESREQEIKNLKGQIEGLSAGPEDSTVFITGGIHPDRPLGRDVVVGFRIGENFDEQFRVHIETETCREQMPGDRYKHTGPLVERRFLHVASNGGPVRIGPRASNAFRVYLED